MTQENVLELIRRSRKPLSTKQISIKLNISEGSTNCNLRKLLNQCEIKCRKQLFNGYVRNLYFK